MNYYYDPGENERVAEARESFSGRLLTDRQFEEVLAITHIIEREIHASGSFKEKLGDYAYAFSRTQRFDAMKAETAIRDIYRTRTGETLNQTRENLIKREEALGATEREQAYQHAVEVGPMIEDGIKMTFNRAFAHQGQQLAQELGVTDAGAKRLMAEEFKAAEGGELYDWGKDLEDKFYRPQIEAEKAEREQSPRTAARETSKSRTRRAGHTRSRGPELRR